MKNNAPKNRKIISPIHTIHATGFVVAPSIIASNHHVIAHGIKNGIARIKYLNAPEPILCILSKIIADDPAHDVALLEVKTGSLTGEAKPLDAQALPLANPFDSVQKGDKVFLTGNPGKYDLTFSQGEVSAF